MGSYPSASLLYGIDLGRTEDADFPWYTDEMEEEYGDPVEAIEHLLKPVPGVGYDTYGNFFSGNTGLALCTQAVHARAYEAEPVGIDRLTGTVEDDARLGAAWTVLYPDQTMPEPAWFMVVSFG